MFPKTHAIYGFFFSLILYFIFPEFIGIFGAVIILASSVLIDVDHYIYYVYKTHSFNLKKSFNWFMINKDKFAKMTPKQKDKIYTGLCFLHGIEAFSIIILLAIISNPFSKIMWFVAIGFFFHHVIDTIDLYIRNYRFDKVISFTYSLINAKNKILLQEVK